MRVYIQAKKGISTDQNHFNAYLYFKEMGLEIHFFERKLVKNRRKERNLISFGLFGGCR